MVVLPLLLYAALHLVGRFFPTLLWCIDQLFYYPWPATALFVAATALGTGAALTASCRAGWVVLASLSYLRRRRDQSESVVVND
jgi:hypothetical protein|tara:strand:+ start:95 stop:346 length:252 start_codon:yes stop_codon:yes gene_type:complete